jgi:radical SAM superfamily enzyme YgiQ (UPF0313 family)
MSAIQDYLRAPIFIVGDPRQGGKDYAERMFKAIKEHGVKNHVALELFGPAGDDFFRMADRCLDGYSTEFSPDSHDENVRHALGRMYDNASITDTVTSAFRNGCSRFDLFYMTGLPEQTRESAMDSARAAEGLWAAVDRKDRLYIYNAPFAPFVDPGSKAFEHPDEYGYVLFAKTLEDHRRLLDSPSWKHVLSYETKWMTRDDIAEVSYDAASELARIEFGAGRCTEESYNERISRTKTARDLLARVDAIVGIGDPEERERRLWEIKEEGERLMASTICNKNDLEWETGSIWSNAPRITAGIIKSAFRRR